MTTSRDIRRRSPVTRILAVLLVVWLLIGVLAAGQRHYFTSSATNCAKAGTIAVTILAGPLNYVGVNPKISCHVPQPSK
jgi:membrane protein YdbS with pleckstrin-like domain